jgi:DNA sulfur modification protein DndC
VVADAELEKHSKPCSSRFGCWVCTAVREDKSLHQMIDSDPTRYGYMRPLAALRDFIANTQYDWSRRQYVGRTIANGHITIAADTYSPQMLAELLRYALSVQRETGVEVVNAAQLLAIDARWSQYAIAPPFTALRIWRDAERGLRCLPPAVRRTPKTPVPRLGLIHVGDDWNDDVQSELEITGLRDPMRELYGESCGPDLRTLSNGRSVVDVEGDSEIDLEDAWLFLDFELDRMLQERADEDQDWTNGYRTYVSMGLLRPAKGSTRRVDEILRRSQWRQRHALHGQQDPIVLDRRLTVRFPQQATLFGDAAARQAG